MSGDTSRPDANDLQHPRSRTAARPGRAVRRARGRAARAGLGRAGLRAARGAAPHGAGRAVRPDVRGPRTAAPRPMR